MSTLQIGLFGDIRATHNDWITEVKITRDNQALLAYLLLKRHKVHSREVLADIFWGEYSPEKARGSLNTALWKLKKVLEPAGIPAGTYLKITNRGGVGFNRESQYWLDVEVFENAINSTLAFSFESVKETNVADLEKALTLYKGELLEGYYKDWALRERERLHTLYLKSLIYLLQYYGTQRTYEKAISYGQKTLELDPLHEEIHREIMRLYLINGQRPLALRQYEVCRSTLNKELGISPSEDTQLLYTLILEGGHREDSFIISNEQINLEQILRQLREASQAIDWAKEQIQQILQLIVNYSKHKD
jgi:DNA-binding SARP family transcriptional activator